MRLKTQASNKINTCKAKKRKLDEGGRDLVETLWKISFFLIFLLAIKNDLKNLHKDKDSLQGATKVN